MIRKMEKRKMKTSVSITPSLDKQLCCWWCTLPIDGHSISCPLKMVSEFLCKERQKEKQETGKFTSEGVFCSYNCAKAYALDRSHNAKYKDSVRYLAIISGNPSIQPAPDKILLVKYGGEMREEQYKASFDRIVYVNDGTYEFFPVTTMFIEKEIM